MAYSKAQLEALKNSLLASSQPDKITASKHRQFEQALINEMFDAETRGNLLALVQTVLNLNVGDSVLVVTNGVLRQIDISEIATSGATRKFLGQFTTEAKLLEDYPNDDPDRTKGDYAQVTETNSYWERDSDTLDWFDTGDVIDDLELDTYPTLGSNDRAATSGGTALLIQDRAYTNHSHSAAEAWLSAIIDTLVLQSDFVTFLENAVAQGPGINISLVDGKLLFTNTGAPGEGSANWGSIGGTISSQSDLNATFLKKYLWKTSTLVGSTRTFDFDHAQNPIFEISPTADEIWEFINVPPTLTEFVSPFVVVNYSGISDYTATLPVFAGKVHKENGKSTTLTEIPFPAGKTSGFVCNSLGFRNSNGDWIWIFGEQEGGAGGGHTIEDEGTPLTQRANLNFVGSGVTVADAGGKTVVTIPGGGGGASALDDLSDVTISSPTNDDIIQRKAGVFVNRTPAQFKTDLSLAKGDVGLGSVDNTADASKPVSTAQATAITAAENNAKSYADGLVVGLWDDRGSFDASGGAYPSTGGSGSAGAIKKGDIWTISVAGTLPTGQVVEVGDVVRAVIDTPGNTQANWAIQQNNIGYVAENATNKTGTVAGNEGSTSLYASVKGVVDWMKQGFTGLLISLGLTKTTPVDADSLLINDSADSNKAKLVTLTNLKAYYKTYFDTVYAPMQVLTTAIASTWTITTGGVIPINTINPASGSSLTSVTIATDLVDGGKLKIKYLKTTASNLVLTFPSGTVVSDQNGNPEATNASTIISSATSEIMIEIDRFGSVYYAQIILKKA